MFEGFADRREAGRALAEKLKVYAGRGDALVLALPRGGVPVGFEVAQALDLPLDVLVARKLGVPGQEEFAFGALASGGVSFLNQRLVNALRLTRPQIESIVERETRELERREFLYRRGRPAADVRGQTVILVDDGLATGATMRVALEALPRRGPAQIVVAAPVASEQACAELRRERDVWCVCALMPEPFYAVGLWYRDFSQVSDAEVSELLDRAALARSHGA